MTGPIDIVKTFKVGQQQNDKIAEIMQLLKKDQSSVIRLLIEVGYLGVKVVTNDDRAGDWKIPGYEQLSPRSRSAILKILEDELPDQIERIRRRNEMLVMQDAAEYQKLLHQHPIHFSKWGFGDIKTIPWNVAKVMIPILEGNLDLLKAYSNFAEAHRRDPTDDELLDAVFMGSTKWEEYLTV